MRNTADVTGSKPIAVLLQSISGLLRHPWKKERGAILLFCPDTTRGGYVRIFRLFAGIARYIST
jgi:hypothetical protein